MSKGREPGDEAKNICVHNILQSFHMYMYMYLYFYTIVHVNSCIQFILYMYRGTHVRAHCIYNVNMHHLID